MVQPPVGRSANGPAALRERVERLRAELRAAEAELTALDGRGAASTAVVQGLEPLLNPVLDSLPVELAVIDAQGVIRLVNGPWARLAELYGRGSDQVLPGANYLDVCRRASASGDADAGAVLQALEDLIAGRRDDCVTEYACPGPGGDRWYLMHARRLPGGAGAVAISHVDITSRWRAEEALRLGRERFEAALQNSNVVVFEQDSELRYTWIHNPALGYLHEQVQGRRDADLFERPGDAELTEGIKREVMSTGVPRREEVTLLAGDALRSYDLSVHPRRDAAGAVVGVTCAAVDITERKRVAEQLRESEARYRQLLDSMDQGFCIVEMIHDANGHPVDYRFIEINATFERHSGLQGALGRTALEMVPNLEMRWVEQYGRVARTGVAERFELGSMALGRVFEVEAVPVDAPSGRQVALLFSDVTERRRAQEALQASEERFRSVFDHAASGIVLIDMRGRLLRCNAAFAQIVGFDEASLRGRGLIGLLVHPDDRASQLATVRPLLTGECQVVHVENRYVRADGGSVWVHKVVSALRDSVGEITNLIAMVTDVTERRRAEGNLAFLAELGTAFAPASTPEQIGQIAARQLMRHFQMSRVTLSDVDPGTGQARVFAGHRASGLKDDQLAHRMADYLGEALLARLHEGQPVFVDDVQRDPHTAAHAAAFAPWAVRCMAIVPHVAEEGARFMLALFDGSPHGWHAGDADFLREVASRIHARIERARAEAAVQASEARLRLAAQTARFGVHDYDVDTDRATWSDELYAIHGMKPGSPVSLPSVLRRLHPDDQSLMTAAMRASLDPAGDGQFDAEFRILRADTGEVRWVYNRSRTLFASDGDGPRRAVRNTGVVLDITERKRAEEHLRHDARRKDEFLAMLAHELRNPLAPIRSTVELMKRGSLPPGTLDRCRDIIDRQSAQMARLLDDLLEMTRLARGDVNLRREPVALREVLDLAIETSRPLIDARHQTLLVAPVDPALLLLADRSRLVQVFANVLNNASKYSHRQGRIEVTLRSTDGMVEISMADEGIGIAPSMLDGLFDLFVQAPEARQHAPGGLGLGLPLARRLVEMHGGAIRAESAGPDRGSRFVVRLPLHHETPEPEAPGEADDSPLAHRPRVVVADDNVDAADTLSLLLESLGCEVRVAYGGTAALEACRAFRPGVVFLDLGMPNPDGYAVCARLRHEPWSTDMRLVAVSGWGRDGDRRRTAATGFDHHLIKPVAAKVLRNVLRDVLTARTKA